MSTRKQNRIVVWCKDYTIKWKIGPITQKPSFSRKRATLMLVLTDDQKVTLTMQAVDDHGNVATISVVPVWQVSDSTLLTVTPAGDGMTAVVETVGALGTCQVNVSVALDTTTITGSLDVQVVAGNAATINITADVPVSK